MSAAPPVYPAASAREHTLADGRRVTIRPIRPGDEPMERTFLERLCDESKRMRFMKFVGAVGKPLVYGFTHVDYAQSMAFVCEADTVAGRAIVGEARYAAAPGSERCEFGVVVADDWRRSGIAGLLMASLMGYARAEGFAVMEGTVLRENRAMLRFARALGFEVQLTTEPTVVQVLRRLGASS